MKKKPKKTWSASNGTKGNVVRWGKIESGNFPPLRKFSWETEK